MNINIRLQPAALNAMRDHFEEVGRDLAFGDGAWSRRLWLKFEHLHALRRKLDMGGTLSLSEREAEAILRSFWELREASESSEGVARSNGKRRADAAITALLEAMPGWEYATAQVAA